MSRLQETQIVPLSAIAAFAALSVHSAEQTRNSENRLTYLSRIGTSLTLMAISLGGLAVSALAQNSAAPAIALEKGFTIPANVQTPIVLQTSPDAACDLHAVGVTDAAHTMRIYANADGYVRVHAMPTQESQPDVRVQLDCTTGGAVTTYPVHLHAGSSPTADMPAPQTSVPVPQGAQVLPGLTENDAQQLSDQDLITRGYPKRPDAVASPAKYSKWLDLVARPITLLPPHSVSRSDISHAPINVNVQNGTDNNANWSGYELQGKADSYVWVNGEWNVPSITIGESGNITYSSMWVGLDGNGTSDLVQAGTEQDYVDIALFQFASYSAWTELLPNQPTSQGVSLSINPGDDIDVGVWVGDSNTITDFHGGYGWFYLQNKTQGQAVRISTPLSGTHFGGSEAEWVLERPTVSGSYAELSCYIIAIMTNAYASPVVGPTIPANPASNLQLIMYNRDNNHPDNNLLSSSLPGGTETIFFMWHNFH
jgi:hypothetical protein